MDFQKVLLDAAKALSADEVKSLAFLCSDKLSRRSASVESASDLFSSLVDRELMSAECPQLLIELLHIIQRVRLVRELKLADQGFTASSKISPYRKLLYGLSEQITEENLKDIKFLLQEKLPRNKLLLGNTTLLDVFLQMEQKDLLSETNLKELESMIRAVCPVLNRRIQDFKALREPCTVIAQEESRPRSHTEPIDPQQAFSHFGKTTGGCFEEQGLKPPTMSLKTSSCTSLDRMARSDFETLTHELSVLCPNKENSALLTAEDDDLKRVPTQQSEAEGLERQTANTESEDLDTYPMNSTKRGVCLIVNNYDFTETRGSVREGTMIDKDSLQTVFQWLGFEVQIEKDCSSSKIKSVLKELSRRDFSQMDCLVCCVLSHGEEGSVSGVDGREVTIKELMNYFDGFKCPTLVEKPKMFFIQACQGNKEQQAVVIESDSHMDCDTVTFRQSIPAVADFLMAMSTYPSFVSFREREKGSWFIQSLCQNLIQMVPRGYDLMSILTKVNADVSLKSDRSGKRKQMPLPAFSLRKRVIFPVPTAPPPSLSH